MLCVSDENGVLLKNGRAAYIPHATVMPQGPGMNWSEMLPPPPNHPPSDSEYNPDDALYSEIPEARSPQSACSCPSSQHSHNSQPVSVAPYVGLYPDNCALCQSLRNYDSRPYSPQQLASIHRQHLPGGLPCGAHAHMARANMGYPPGPGSQRSGGTPVYMHGYSQPWDSQRLPRGPYDYELANMGRVGGVEEGYNYTQPIQDGLIGPGQGQGQSGTLKTRGGQCWRPDMVAYPGSDHSQHSDSANIPGGPPGNYCEGPCRGQGGPVCDPNHINSLSSGYVRNINESGPLPYLEGYKLESSASSGTGSDYRVCNSGGSAGTRSTGQPTKQGSYPHHMYTHG